MHPLTQLKQTQKANWSHFIPLEAMTTPCAARLVKHIGPVKDKKFLDVACGTGVVAITAALKGAKVTALDLTPELLERARQNGELAKVEIPWHEGDVEELPFADGEFDVVASQFGHMFAPRPEVAIDEMLRVLKPGGVIAFSTWPPELFVGRGFIMIGRYLPPLPFEMPPPPLWGDPNVIRERLSDKVKEIQFDRATMYAPALTPQHFRAMIERTAGPVIKLVETLKDSDPEKLAAFRAEYEKLVSEYWEDNLVRQDFLLTRGVKV